MKLILSMRDASTQKNNRIITRALLLKSMSQDLRVQLMQLLIPCLKKFNLDNPEEVFGRTGVRVTSIQQ
jgi:hypothetical protein